MQFYQEMLEHVLVTGKRKTNRTGIDTLSVFGYQWRYDMRYGFPLLTTKKMFTKAIIHELIWFISGDTNIKYLKDNGVTIWDEWANKNGELGPVYGKQWVAWPQYDIDPFTRERLDDLDLAEAAERDFLDKAQFFF